MFRFSSSLWCLFYYVKTTLSMLLLQQHIFNGIKITFFGIFKLRIKVTLFLGLPLWNTLKFFYNYIFPGSQPRILNNITNTSTLQLRFVFVCYCEIILSRDNYVVCLFKWSRFLMTSGLRCIMEIVETCELYMKLRYKMVIL